MFRHAWITQSHATHGLQFAKVYSPIILVMQFHQIFLPPKFLTIQYALINYSLTALVVQLFK